MSDTAKTAAFLDRAAAEAMEIAKGAKSKGGPQTPEGKAASSKNALKHGLSSAMAIVPGEDSAEYDQTLCDLRMDHRPRTAAEDQCIQQMAHAHWKITRCARLEQAIWDLELGATTAETSPFHKMSLAFLKGSNVSSAFDKLSRYQAEARRAYHQAAATLRRHQPFVQQSLEADRKRTFAQEGAVALIGMDAVAYGRSLEVRKLARPATAAVTETNPETAPNADNRGQ